MRKSRDLVHRDTLPAELQRYLCGTFFDRSYVDSLTASVLGAPAPETFRSPVPSTTPTLKPSKRRPIKATPNITQQHPGGTPDRISETIWDTRPYRGISYKRGPAVPRNGWFLSLMGGPSLGYNADKPDCGSPACRGFCKFYSEGDPKVGRALAEVVNSIINEPFFEDELQALVADGLTARGFTVSAQYSNGGY